MWKTDNFKIGKSLIKNKKEYFPKDRKLLIDEDIYGDIYYMLDNGSLENGKGIIFYSNGDVYVGDFKNKLRDGEGHYFFSQGRSWMDSCMPLDGPWKQDDWMGPIV